MSLRRRTVPLLLVALVLVVTGASAAVAVAGGPSSDQVALQNAAEATLLASGFRWATVGVPPDFSGRGRYLAPDRLEVTTGGGAHSSRLTLVGRSPGSSTPPQFIEAMTNGALYPQVPPLGTLTAVTDVVRRGDTYTFEIDTLTLGQGVVAPGQHVFGPLLPAVPVVHDTPATATVRGGRIVALSLPDGITWGTGGRQAAAWAVWDIGTGPG